MSHRALGKEVPRADGFEKVTGQAVFVGDIRLPGVLHAQVLRSSHAHARIIRLDVSRALALPGVKAVVTGQDCPSRIGICLTDQYPLARDRVRFFGEPVAAVIATSELVARQALDLIDVEYEPLPAITDPREAMKPGAPLIHDELEDYARLPGFNPQPGTNIFHHFKIRRGDPEKAFAQADLIVEREYGMPSISHVQLEPHGTIAQMVPGGQMTIWSSTQAPFIVRSSVAKLFRLPPARVRVIAPYLGGGFGGKSDVTIEPLVACLAMAVPGRPVRLMLTREEAFMGTVIGRGLYARVKTAVTRDGKILGEEINLILNGGGYGDYAINIVGGAALSATGPYEIANLKIDSYGVYTNTPPTGACRGYGHPEVHWAIERHRDIIARELGLDPVEFRRRNLLGEGKVNALGQVLREDNGRVDLCLDAVIAELGGSPSGDSVRATTGSRSAAAGAGTVPHVRRGTGIAAFMKTPIMTTNAQSGAIIRLNEDGTANVSVGAVEMGQGAYTALAQIAAEALRLPPEKVRVVPFVDTEFSPHEWQTVASHTTWAVGNAIILAAADVLCQLRKAAARVWGVRHEDLSIADGKVFLTDDPSQVLTFGQLAVGYTLPSGEALNDPIIGRGSFVPRGLVYPDPVTGQGNAAADWTFGCQGAEVEVDTRTGEITVKRLITAIDVGRVVNPLLARGQILGGMVQAMGSALSEQLIYSADGKMRNHSLTDYKVPGPEDIPTEMKVIFIETPDHTGPFGSRGLGEHGAVGVPPAIANAIANALGIEFFNLPITAGDIVRALKGE